MTFFYRVMRVIARQVFVLVFAGRALGRRHVPRRGGVVIICNHQSYFDPVLVGLGLPRMCHFMARDTLFAQPSFARLIRSLNAFPVKRGTADVGALKESLRRLKAGAVVLAFPEATRTRDGSIGQFHPGVVLIAQRAGAPIVPAVLRGAYECWPRERKWPRRHPIHVIYGRGLTPAEMENMTQEQIMTTLRQRMLDMYEKDHKPVRSADRADSSMPPRPR